MSRTKKSLKSVITQIVQEIGKPLTAADIAQYILAHAKDYPDIKLLQDIEQLKKQEINDIRLSLQRNITSLYCQKALQPLNIFATPERPRHFYYKPSNETEKVNAKCEKKR